MRKIALIILSIVAFWINSCSPNDPQVNAWLGRWQIIRVQSNLKASTASELNYDKMLSSTEPLYFQFLANNSFGTNTDLSITKLLVDLGSTYTGTYKAYQQNNQNRLDINFYDPLLDQQVVLHFVVNVDNSSMPLLVMNKADYQLSLRDSAAMSTTSIQKVLQDFANQVTSANFILTLEKIN